MEKERQGRCPFIRIKKGWEQYHRILLWILVVCWMAVIFAFSAQNGEQSAELSGGITESLVELFVENYEQLPPARQVSIKDQVSHVVRKLAHFTEYLILGVLLYRLVADYPVSKRMRFLLAWIIGTVYAVSDEFHQMFSDGRSPQLLDVCIDSAGVLTGVILLLLIDILRQRRKEKV